MGGRLRKRASFRRLTLDELAGELAKTFGATGAFPTWAGGEHPNEVFRIRAGDRGKHVSRALTLLARQPSHGPFGWARSDDLAAFLIACDEPSVRVERFDTAAGTLFTYAVAPGGNYHGYVVLDHTNELVGAVEDGALQLLSRFEHLAAELLARR